MRILHLLPSLNIYGGTPSKIKDLIPNSRHEHVIYCPKCYEGKDSFKLYKTVFQNLNIKVIEGFYGFNILKHIFFIHKTIIKERIQIIQCYFYFEVFLAFILKLLNKNIRVVFSFEGSLYPINKFAKPLISLSLRSVDQFIFISNYVKISNQKTHPFLLNRRTVVIYNGAKNRVLDKKSVMTSPNSLVTISNLNGYKNLFLIIHVMDILVNEKHMQLELDIIGEGPLRIDLQKEIEKFNLKNNVHLLGTKSNVGDYLEKSTIYVHPSNMEGFGISVVEAMLSKTPVIASNYGALPEIVINNESGIIVKTNAPLEWADQICQLLQSKERRNKLALNGYKRAKDFFSIETYVKNIDNLYEEQNSYF